MSAEQHRIVLLDAPAGAISGRTALPSLLVPVSVALELEEFDAKTRYSLRDGKREKVRT